MATEVPITTHFHECEGRWHAYANLTLSLPGRPEVPARFDGYDKVDVMRAARQVTEMMGLFLQRHSSGMSVSLEGSPEAS